MKIRLFFQHWLQKSAIGSRLSKAHLRFVFFVFFLALAIPSAIISYTAYEKIRLESVYQYQQMSQTLISEINNVLHQALLKEELRKDEDYSFLTTDGYVLFRFWGRSILSSLPVESNLPGIIGYFQIDAKGEFNSPLLPENLSGENQFALSPKSIESRVLIASNVHKILFDNQLVSTPFSYQKNEAKRKQISNENDVVEDQVIEDNKQAPGFTEKLTELANKRPIKAKLPPRPNRKEKRNSAKPNELDKVQQLTDHNAQNDISNQADDNANAGIFETELEPFRVHLLSNEYFVVYRQVWRDGNRKIQGALLSVEQLIKQAITLRFERSSLAKFSHIDVTVNIEPTRHLSAGGNNLDKVVNTNLLEKYTLSAPFNQLDVLFYVTDLPGNDSGQFVLAFTVLLVLALIFGTFALYRLTYRQALQAQQQQDFVSAVSHELNTPITSIKMYGELLKNGWLDDEKKQQYYDFICSESDRLSRLVANILQISNVSRNELNLQLKPIYIEQLADTVSSQVQTQINQANFEYQYVFDQSLNQQSVNVDMDAVTQIVINLVDNAIKYSANCPVQKVDITIREAEYNKVCIAVRDHGIGIDSDEIDNIFSLFYRVGNELTRHSKGTGIGLALVKELSANMQAEIHVISHEVGCEFQILLPKVQ